MKCRPGLLVSALSVWVLIIGCQRQENVNPVIFTLETQNIAQSEATFVGELRDLGVRSTWVYGFVWSDQAGTNIASGNVIVLGEKNTGGVFSAKQENLNAGSTYYVKAFVSDPGYNSIFYAAEVAFNTLP